METDKKIILLVGNCRSSIILFNALKNLFSINKMIIEQPLSRLQILKRRIHNLGIFKVIDQVFFRCIIVPLLNIISRSRIKEIIHQYNMNSTLKDHEKIIYVNNINSEQVLAYVNQHDPDLIVVNGTRIISETLLSAINMPVINIHAGITPLYRGVHGAYWALVNNDKKNCGVTIHLIDKGIDTGPILRQGTIAIGNKDNFVTYPLLQLGIGIQLLNQVILDALNNQIKKMPGPEGESRLWTHPTFSEYIFNWLWKKIK